MAEGAKAEVDAAVSSKLDRSPVYVMRHGQTALDMLKRSDGWLDFPLTDDGRRGLLPAQRYLKDLPKPLTHIHAATLKRTKESAEIIKSGMGIDSPKIVLTEESRPWNLGKELIGSKKKEARPIVKFFMNHPDKVPSGGESLNAFRKRFMTWFKAKTAAESPGPILFVLSGSNIREISAHISGNKDIFDLDEGGLLALRPVGNMWSGTIICGGKDDSADHPSTYGS